VLSNDYGEDVKARTTGEIRGVLHVVVAVVF
jgi:hypothetical protein